MGITLVPEISTQTTTLPGGGARSRKHGLRQGQATVGTGEAGMATTGIPAQATHAALPLRHGPDDMVTLSWDDVAELKALLSESRSPGDMAMVARLRTTSGMLVPARENSHRGL